MGTFDCTGRARRGGLQGAMMFYGHDHPFSVGAVNGFGVDWLPVEH